MLRSTSALSRVDRTLLEKILAQICLFAIPLDLTSYSSVSCAQTYFAVPAEWSTWSSWSDCSVTCGLGERIRIRVCGEDTEEFVDENNCQGNPEQIQICHMSECPVSKETFSLRL
jgi:hypothetical protein